MVATPNAVVDNSNRKGEPVAVKKEGALMQ